MANNEHINKVVKSTGETLIDLTSDTVTAGTLLQGETAHDRSGAQIEGAVIVAPTDVTETEDNTAYLYKNSEHDAVYDELVGGSAAWNQLVANSGSSLSVTITSGHKYAMKKSGTLSVGTSSGSAITGLTGGTDWITDLTLMFGATIADYVYNLEQSTAGSGIAWLKSYGFFTKDYYAYNAGGLVSVNTSGKKVVSETTEITYPIKSTDLRGLYKLNGSKLYTDGDIYSADGTITRKYGIIDLGRLNWYMTTNNCFYANVEQGSTGIITNALCSKYVITNTPFANLQDKEMNYGQPVVAIGWRGVGVRDSAYTDAATFKTAMSGVYLIYELATPATENAQPFTSPQMVYRNGTEEYLDTRDVPMPVGGNRKYIDIPDWMVNEYFDDMRADSSRIDGIKKEADTLEEHLKAFIIESNIGEPTRINNASDFTVELFDKIWGTNTDLYPRFAHLFLFGNEAHFLKAIIESIVVNTYTPTHTSEKLIQATFISEMSMYYFRWVRGQAPSMNKYTISVT